jgi:3',5'-cyclic AMP phosphodiesterase CpdA
MAGQLELKLARRARRYVKAPETIARLVMEGLRQGVDHVILSGDLTALALDSEFEVARKALGDLVDRPDKITVVPGNHDIFTPGSRLKRRFESWFGDLLDSDLPALRAEGAWPHVRLVGDAVAVVGLCSARVPLVPGIAAGRVGEAQLSALEKICAHPRLRGRSIHVVVHHAPLRWDGSIDRKDHGLADAQALLDVCARGRVAAIHCGHIHLRYAWQVAGGPMIVGGGSSTWLGHEGYWVVDSAGGRITGLQNCALAEATVPAVVAAPGYMATAG